MEILHNETTAFQGIDWKSWKPDQRATLLFVRRDSEILLIEKKRGLGAGKINGPGGRIDPGETALECAVREVNEEVGIVVRDVRDAGKISFQFTDGFALHVTVFTASRHAGAVRETEEAVPIWTPVDEIPYDRMWADDRIWLPWLLRGIRFEGRALFRGDSMLGYQFWTSHGSAKRIGGLDQSR